MSEISTRIRKLVDDPTVSDKFEYGAWGILQPVQRRLIRQLCDTCDAFEKAADDYAYTLIGVMHSVDKWLDGDELKQDEVNRAITMREKTLQIIEGANREIASLQETLSNCMPSGCQACSEDEAIQIGKEYGKRDAATELLNKVRAKLPDSGQFHNSDIKMGFEWALSAVRKILSEIEQEVK